MTEEKETSVLRQKAHRYRRRLFQNLRALGVVRVRPEELEDLELAMEGALHQVHPTADFRTHLRQNLALAARQRVSDLAVEYPRPLRQGIILGVSAGLLAATVAAIVFIVRGRAVSAER